MNKLVLKAIYSLLLGLWTFLKVSSKQRQRIKLEEKNPFSYTQRVTTYNFFSTCRSFYFLRLGVPIFRVTLLDYAQILLKSNNLLKWYDSVCFYFLCKGRMYGGLEMPLEKQSNHKIEKINEHK